MMHGNRGHKSTGLDKQSNRAIAGLLFCERARVLIRGALNPAGDFTKRTPRRFMLTRL
jgi:hypothetical protein